MIFKTEENNDENSLEGFGDWIGGPVVGRFIRDPVQLYRT